MAAPLSPAELRNRVRRDVERAVLRARNGIKYVAGVDKPQVGRTPKDTVWAHHKLELWRYRSDRIEYRPPLLIVMSLVSRSYILDLYPGNSFVERFRDAGFDVLMLDWGTPDEVEAANTLETYVDDYLPRAVRATLDATGSDEVSMLGYCYGGVLAVIHAARHPELPIRNLIGMATPTDFRCMGLMGDMFKGGRIEPADVIDETGNVPPEVIMNGFRLLKPTGDLTTYATLWEHLWDDQYMEGFQAMGQWTRDHIPFPGATFRQTVDQLLRENGLVEGTLTLDGTTVDLKQIACPFLNVIAEKDHIVPVDAARPLTKLVGSDDVEELALPAGHVALAAGRQAGKVTIPAIIDWLRRHSEEV